MQNSISVFDVADYFLSKSSMTQKKLQKMVYYAYSKYLIENNETSSNITRTFFNELPEAWIHGPVFPSLYQKFKSYNWKNILKVTDQPIFEEQYKKILDLVFEKYNCYDADQLEYITHQEKAWKNARKGIDTLTSSNNKMSLVDIFNSDV